MASIQTAQEIAETPEDRRTLLVRNAVLAFTAVLGLAALLRFVFVCFYDYDELSHAHMVWLVSVGEVPYRDFAANHFPFLWLLLSPLMRVLPESPAALVVLRGLALSLNLVFIGSFAALICAELPARQRVWAVVCFGLVAFSPLAMQYLIEFRPDAVANAVIFFTLAWLRFRGLRNVSTAFVSGFCIGVALLINTKYLIFPFILGAVALVLYFREIRRIWSFVLAICLGFGFAVLAGFLVLLWLRVPLDNAWQMVVAYNSAIEKAHTFGFGLAHALARYPFWLAYSLAGVAGCAVLFFRQRRLPDLLAMAVFIFLAVNLVMTTRPWLQYIVSWLLLAAYFPARCLPSLLARLPMRTQTVMALLVLVIVGGFASKSLKGPNAGEVSRPAQDRVIEWVSQNVPANDYVVSTFFLHPVFRKDTFFKTVKDVAPSFRGDGLEVFMPLLAPSPYSEHFQHAGYEKDLEARPPAVIVMDSSYTSAQVSAMEAYLTRHADDYEQYEIPGTSIVIQQRKRDGIRMEK